VEKGGIKVAGVLARWRWWVVVDVCNSGDGWLWISDDKVGDRGGARARPSLLG
jgi:hypothetical protein